MTDALVLKNWKGKDPCDLDLKLLKLCAKTKIKTNLGLNTIVDSFNQFARAFHCMQVSVTADRSEQPELNRVVSQFHKKFQTNYPGLYLLYQRETRGWQRLANIKKEQDIVPQYEKIKVALEALELAFLLERQLAARRLCASYEVSFESILANQ